jgi:hypothetical protein
MDEPLRLRDGLWWAGSGLIAALVYWFVCGVIFFVLDSHADKTMDSRLWLQWVFGLGMLAVFVLPAVAWARDRDGMTWWAILLALLLVAFPAFGPLDSAISWATLPVGVLLAGICFWLGARPGARGRRVYYETAGTNFNYAAVLPALIVAVALLFHPAYGDSGSPARSADFCSTHSCIGNFDEGQGSITRCSDGTYSHSGGVQGACSWHGGVAGY